jgi:AraC-like DNA-binding protein
MESLFFQLESRRFRRRVLQREAAGETERVDVASGVLFFLLRSRQTYRFDLRHRDRMALLILTVRGGGVAESARRKLCRFREGDALLMTLVGEDLHVRLAPESELFILAVADFHLKRYLSGRESGAVDRLYETLRERSGVGMLRSHPLDALSLYLLERIVAIGETTEMAGLRAELRGGELLLHQLGFLELPDGAVAPEDRELALRARKILAEEFADPPAIPELARRCATNDFRLKKVFKQVYGTTLYAYVQKLRLEEANWLLRQKDLSVREVALRVGYRHAGHFSRLFHRHYGVYPKELAKNSTL